MAMFVHLVCRDAQQTYSGGQVAMFVAVMTHVLCGAAGGWLPCPLVVFASGTELGLTVIDSSLRVLCVLCAYRTGCINWW